MDYLSNFIVLTKFSPFFKFAAFWATANEAQKNLQKWHLSDCCPHNAKSGCNCDEMHIKEWFDGPNHGII